MNREERQQARTDRYRELADNARKQSEQCFRQSESMASVIPMGQPVHGKADRNYREKIWNKMGQSVKASEKADYYERKAEAAENNNAIYLDDDNAVEKLEQNDGNLTLRGKTYHVEVPQRVQQAVIPVLAVGLYYGIDSGTVAAMARYIFMFMSMKPDSADVAVRAAFCHHCEDYISLMEYYPPADHGMEAYTRA